MNLKANLWVNEVFIEMNPFVEQFLARTTLGAVASLKRAKSIEILELYQENGNINITLNGHKVPLAPFPNDIICSTLTGLASSLKNVDEIDSLKITINVDGENSL